MLDFLVEVCYNYRDLAILSKSCFSSSFKEVLMMKVTVNGKRITVPGGGGSISIVNGEVFVDGQRYTENEETKQVNIIIEGSCGSIQVDACDRVEVKGDVRGNLEVNGSVTIHGNARENVRSGGSVRCGNVGGSINAGGGVYHS